MDTPTKPQLSPTRYLTPNPLVKNTIRVCPDCAGPISHTGGCMTCQQCGWGRCA